METQLTSVHTNSVIRRCDMVRDRCQPVEVLRFENEYFRLR
jgi:hypothetical protein